MQILFGTLLVVCKQQFIKNIIKNFASRSKNTSGGKLYHEFNEGQSQVRGLAWFPNSKIIKLFWFAEECSKAENGAITIFSKHASHNLTHHNFTGALSPKCANLPPKHLNVCLIRVHGFCLLEVLYDRRFKQQPAVEDTCFYDIFRSMFEEIEEIHMSVRVSASSRHFIVKSWTCTAVLTCVCSESFLCE